VQNDNFKKPGVPWFEMLLFGRSTHVTQASSIWLMLLPGSARLSAAASRAGDEEASAPLTCLHCLLVFCFIPSTRCGVLSHM
jgi:hypothetical protein